MSNNEKLLPFWDGSGRQLAFPLLPYSVSRIFLLWFHYWDVLAEFSHLLKLVENSCNSETELKEWLIPHVCAGAENFVY